jgi:hypothetical protein
VMLAEPAAVIACDRLGERSLVMQMPPLIPPCPAVIGTVVVRPNPGGIDPGSWRQRLAEPLRRCCGGARE